MPAECRQPEARLRVEPTGPARLGRPESGQGLAAQERVRAARGRAPKAVREREGQSTLRGRLGVEGEPRREAALLEP